MSNLSVQAPISAPGTIPLSRREIDVLLLVSEGHSSKEIGERLFISKRTVEFHLDNIYGKLDVSNRISACRRAAELGLVSAI